MNKSLHIVKVLACITCSLSAVFAFAQADSSRLGLTVSVPNGFASISMDDMQLASSAGPVRWSRTWDGKEWKFNPQWESLSQSWTNLTGATTGSPSAGAAAAPTDAAAGCWVMVDEDWQPSKGTVLMDERPPFPPMLSERTTPFNKLMGEDEDDYPPPRIVNVDYANLCKGIALQNSPVRDLEAVRIKNELYLGENGRYAYTNRTVLEKRAVRALPSIAAASIDTQLATGKLVLAPVDVAKGFRWMDKAGAWIDYNTQGQVVSYGDKNDNRIWLVRDASGTLRGVVDVNGRVLFSLHYAGKLIAEVRDYPIAGMARDLPPRSVKYGYDIGNRLTSVTDVRGYTTNYDYDAGNHLTLIIDQEKRHTKMSYAGSSVKQLLAPDGGVTDYAFEFDDVNKQFISRVTGPQTLAGRKVEELTHNRSGQLVRRLVNGGVEEEVLYDTGARIEARTNARGFVTRTTSDEYNQPVHTLRADGTNTKQRYSAIDLALIESSDPNGMTTKYEYDARANLSKVIEAAGTSDERVTELENNLNGQPIRTVIKGRTEANGVVTPDAVTTYEYDLQGTLKSVTKPELGTDKLQFNRAGKLVLRTDPRDYTTLFDNDAAGNVVKVTDAMEQSNLYEFDKVGNLIAKTNAAGEVTRTTYDSANRPTVTEIESQSKSEVKYDSQGMRVLLTDGDGRRTSLAYDNFQRLQSTTDGLQNSIGFGYNVPDGSATGVLGSLDGPTEVSYPTYFQQKRYDALERVTSAKSVDSKNIARASSFSYDGRGAVTSETDAYGKSETTAYDALGRATVHTDRLGKKTFFIHDVRGNLIQITDANNNVRKFEYDRNNRIVKEVLPLGQSSEFKYDPAGNMEEFVDENRQKRTYTFDKANRPTKVAYLGTNGQVLRESTFKWRSTDQLIEWNHADANGASKGTLTYDGAGRKTAETVIYPGGYSMGYAYTYSVGGKKRNSNGPMGPR